jgi:hypothetical protein
MGKFKDAVEAGDAGIKQMTKYLRTQKAYDSTVKALAEFDPERTLTTAESSRRKLDNAKRLLWKKLNGPMNLSDNPLLSRESANKAMNAASEVYETPAIKKARVKPSRRSI